MTRIRTRETDHTEGSYTVYTVFSPRTYGGGVFEKSSQFCEDTINSKPMWTPHDLELTNRVLKKPLYLTGTWYKSPSVIYQVNDHYSPGGFFSYSSMIPATNLENWDYWFTKAIANMNPNTPKVDLPLFIYEMKDFPRMLKNLGRWLQFKSTRRGKSSKILFQEFKRVIVDEDPNALIPDSFLSYNFGWAPLMADLLGLFDIHTEWESKLQQLRQMKGGERLKRDLHNSDETLSGSYYDWLFAAIGTYAHYDVNRMEHIWFTAYPTLLSDVPERDSNVDFNRLMFGLKADSIVTAWNAIPWSWLIDYFSNIGDVLKASDGILDWKYDKICVMSHQEAVYTCTSFPVPPGISVVELPKAAISSKRRRVRNHPTPKFAMTPWLSTKQVANMGAIGLLYLLR